ncbi:rRNA-processing protein las1 [Dispira parvispora]|uniref:rRNA-processing protein las1 n=1 Tax=Dispira parvispora TaxID=1520584 RepID=A0A9W8AQ57_9FUNG|nr:rRNA-processing protein las1 [Dispira parvispora]
MSHLRVVPWIDQAEFEQVRGWLFAPSSQEHLRDLGVKRVKAWSARCRIPHSVEATAALVEVQRRDQLSAQILTVRERRLLYSTAFIRFFNGIVDHYQTGAFARSVALISQEVGMPPWFVDLRHAATHDDLPSLYMLQKGCTEALHWLYNNYWQVQTPANSQELIGFARDLLQKYRTLQLTHLMEAKAKKSSDSVANRRLEMTELIERITSLLDSEGHSAEAVVDVLLQPDFLVPLAKNQRSSFPDLRIPTANEQLWWPFIQYMDEQWPQFVTTLLQSLVRTVGSSWDSVVPDVDDPTQSNSYRLTLVAWVKRIFTAHFQSIETDAMSESEPTLFPKLQFDVILEDCLRRPGLFTRAILQVMADLQPTMAADIEPFIRIMGRALHREARKDSATSVTYLDDDEMDKERQLFEERNSHIIQDFNQPEQNDQSVERVSGWPLVEKSTWRECPIGALPGGKLPCLDLPLEWDNARSVES